MCPYSAYLCFDEIEHHRIKPCRAGFLFFLSCFLFFYFTSVIHVSPHSPPQNHRQNALAMLYSKGSAPKKRGKKKEKTKSLDHPHPTYLLHRPCAPSCLTRTRGKFKAVQHLVFGLTPPSPPSHLSRHLRTSRRFHILQIILLIVRSSFFQHSVDSSLFESFLKGWVVSWNFFFSISFLLFALRVNYGTYSQAFFVLSKKRFAFVGFGGSSDEF